MPRFPWNRWTASSHRRRWCLRTNGKPEAGTQLDLSTQLLVSHLPMMAKPDAKDVFVLGLASGMTAGAMLAYPIDRLDIAENCEPVIHGV